MLFEKQQSMFNALDALVKAASSSDHGPDDLILDPQALNSVFGCALFDEKGIDLLKSLSPPLDEELNQDGIIVVPSRLISLYGDLLVILVDLILLQWYCSKHFV
jgi:hypothetical protein